MNLRALRSNPDVLGGIVLLFAALAAMLFVNLGGASLYKDVLEYRLTLGVSPLALEKTIHHWINDGLMVLFFLLVGIEINREVRIGNLRTPKTAMLPVIAAIGGFALPALIYLGINWNSPGTHGGWSIPTATDIAFAVALVTVFRNSIPVSLRVFLLALAVVDDLLAILVIAVFYTAEVIWMNLFLAGAAAFLLILQHKLGIQRLWVYILAGLFVWLCVLKSGVHATVAGVIIGLLLPLKSVDSRNAPADTVEHALQPWVRWVVLPLFAFANVGIDVRDLGLHSLTDVAMIGIVAGLFLGKQVGIFGTVWLLDKVGIPKPEGASWRQVYAVSCMCGIGFTMSLFIGALALPAFMQPEVRLGVLLGSLFSAWLAVSIIRGESHKPVQELSAER